MTNVAAASAATALNGQFRINISHRTLNGARGVIEDLAKLPIETERSVHLALVDDVGIGYENHVRYTEHLAERFIELIDLAMDAGFEVAPTDYSLADCAFCGAVGGKTGAVINADGTLYSCWETAGRDGWAVGDIVNGYAAEEAIRPSGCVRLRHEEARLGLRRARLP